LQVVTAAPESITFIPRALCAYLAGDTKWHHPHVPRSASRTRPCALGSPQGFAGTRDPEVIDTHLTYNLRHMTEPLIYYKPCHIGDTYYRECLTCGAIVKNEGLHTIYHEQQVSPKRCPKCGLLDIGRHICPSED